MAETLERAPAERAHAHPESLMDVPPELKQNVLVTSLNTLVNWGRQGSIWPLTFGLA